MSLPPKPSAIPAPCLCPGLADDDALAAWRQMAHSFLKMQHRVEDMLVPYNLALSQFEALAKIGMYPGVIQQELVRHLLVTKGNVGALIDRLEQGKLLERRTDPTDRRANRLYLTPAGEALVSELFEKHRMLVQDMFQPLGAAQRRTLISLLKEVEPQSS